MISIHGKAFLLRHPRPRGGDAITARPRGERTIFTEPRVFAAADAALLDPHHKGEDDGVQYVPNANSIIQW